MNSEILIYQNPTRRQHQNRCSFRRRNGMAYPSTNGAILQGQNVLSASILEIYFKKVNWIKIQLSGNSGQFKLKEHGKLSVNLELFLRQTFTKATENNEVVGRLVDGFILKREDRSQKDIHISLIDYAGLDYFDIFYFFFQII